MFSIVEVAGLMQCIGYRIITTSVFIARASEIGEYLASLAEGVADEHLGQIAERVQGWCEKMGKMRAAGAATGGGSREASTLDIVIVKARKAPAAHLKLLTDLAKAYGALPPTEEDARRAAIRNNLFAVAQAWELTQSDTTQRPVGDAPLPPGVTLGESEGLLTALLQPDSVIRDGSEFLPEGQIPLSWSEPSVPLRSLHHRLAPQLRGGLLCAWLTTWKAPRTAVTV